MIGTLKRAEVLNAFFFQASVSEGKVCSQTLLCASTLLKRKKQQQSNRLGTP